MDYAAVHPPSTHQTCPVTCPVSWSSARNATTAATSLGSASLACGILALNPAVAASPSASTIGTAVGPGATALTRIPCLAYSTAAVLTMAITAPLEMA
ncbi:hypothetical protein CGRA01v4_12227 [Colletotrichum graminicola]|nr:hypothetical protein CGRA01v4_12227 [Colletotrichum graminicola]